MNMKIILLTISLLFGQLAHSKSTLECSNINKYTQLQKVKLAPLGHGEFTLKFNDSHSINLSKTTYNLQNKYLLTDTYIEVGEKLNPYEVTVINNIFKTQFWPKAPTPCKSRVCDGDIYEPIVIENNNYKLFLNIAGNANEFTCK